MSKPLCPLHACPIGLESAERSWKDQEYYRRAREHYTILMFSLILPGFKSVEEQPGRIRGNIKLGNTRAWKKTRVQKTREHGKLGASEHRRTRWTWEHRGNMKNWRTQERTGELTWEYRENMSAERIMENQRTPEHGKKKGEHGMQEWRNTAMPIIIAKFIGYGMDMWHGHRCGIKVASCNRENKGV